MHEGSAGRRRSGRLFAKTSLSRFKNDASTAVDLTMDDDFETPNINVGRGEQRHASGVQSGGRLTKSKVRTILGELGAAVVKGGSERTMDTVLDTGVHAKATVSHSTCVKGKEDIVDSGDRSSKKRKAARDGGSGTKANKTQVMKKGRTGAKGKEKAEEDSDSDNNKGVVKTVFPGMRIRTSPKPLLVAIRCLSEAQRKCVEEMGFGSLLAFQIDELPAKLAYFVVDSYDDQARELRLSNGSIKVTVELIHAILGLPVGGTPLELLENNQPDVELTSEWWGQFGNLKDVSPGQIKKRIVISNEADWNFRLNFIALVSNTLGVCKMRGKADVSVLKYITRNTNFRTVDWSRYFWKLV